MTFCVRLSPDPRYDPPRRWSTVRRASTRKTAVTTAAYGGVVSTRASAQSGGHRSRRSMEHTMGNLAAARSVGPNKLTEAG